MAQATFLKGEFQKAQVHSAASNPITTSIVNVAQTRYGQTSKAKRRKRGGK